MEDRDKSVTPDDGSGGVGWDVSLAGLSDDSQERLLSLAAFPPGLVSPFWLLGLLWGMSERRARIEGDRLAGWAVVGPAGVGLRLNDATREAIRRFAPGQPAAVSARLLDALRPAGGWHELSEGQRPFLNTVCFHLHQAARSAELGELLRDMRLLVVRLAAFGPVALENDLESYGDATARELAELLCQEGRLFTAGLSTSDIALTLESRLAARPSLLAWLDHIDQTRPAFGLLALRPPPDRDDPALLRSFSVPLQAGQSGEYDIDWHPGGDLLAMVTGGPTLQIFAADSGTRDSVVELPGALLTRVQWSPDGTRVAVLDVGYRRLEPKWTVSEGPYYAAVLSVCDPQTGTELDTLAVPQTLDLGFCWAPDSALLAVSGHTKVWLWRPGADEPPRLLPGETIIQKLGGDRNPDLELSDDDDSDLDSPPRVLGRALAWDFGHGLLAYGCTTLLHWVNPDKPEPPDIWPVPVRDAAVDLQWRPGGHTAALATYRATLVVDPLARQVRIEWPHGTGMTGGLRWSPDGSRLAVREPLGRMGGGEALVRLWHIPADAELAQGKPPSVTSVIRLGPEHHINGVLAWRPDATAIAATETAQQIKLWRSDTPRRSTTEQEQPLALTHVMWNPDGTELAVRAQDSRWFRVDPAQPHASMRKCAPNPYSTRDRAMRARYLDEVGLPFVQKPPVVEGARGERDILELAPDGLTYAWVDHLERLRVINPDGNRLIELNLLPMSRGQRINICFTPDSAHVIAASRTSHYLAAWPLTQPTQESPAAEWRQHDHPTDAIPAIAFIEQITASNTHLAMIAYPSLIGLFALTDMHNICWIKTNAPLREAAFDPTGHRLAIAGEAGLYLFAVHDPDTF